MKSIKEDPNPVTWYSPKVVWFERSARPERIETKYYRNKEDYKTNFAKVVLEWSEIKAPKTWEQCE